MKIHFTKCHANGNDFILILKQNFPSNISKEKIIRLLCNRNKGIGADGLFIISNSNNYDFLLDYYNSDGSWETLCANGSRCACLFMFESNSLINKKMTFEAGDGIHKAEIKNDNSVSMSMITPKYKSQLISPEGFNGYFIDSGARHFVSEYKKMENDENNINIAKKIRFHEIFMPKGANINFYNKQPNNIINILTYEKGIEKFVLSCSSGSMAVVYHLYQTLNLKPPITTFSLGGSLKFDFDENLQNIWCTGPSEILFFGDFNYNLKP
tara:strand:- start:1111 stop:1914 length:804 start_codon:yes stop_codon:yes gene_type:complete